MAFIRNLFVTAITMLCVLFTKAQTISYPVSHSHALKATTSDVAVLLQKAVSGNPFTIATYSTIPANGIVFIYDSSIKHNQACRVQSNGVDQLTFSAPEDNGLIFGVYQYLQQLGFRFYLPGTNWEMIPNLTSIFTKIDTTYATDFKYNNWFISGGHRRWVMDNDDTYNWDTYNGLNGHNWSLYQRRNGMGGQFRFAGHRSDIIAGSNLPAWQSNPCFIASFNNSRQVNSRSVPDVNSTAAMQLWSSTIQQKYEAYRNTIFADTNLYIGQYRNFKYSNANVGIEVPDGALWGNTVDNAGCNSIGYSKESDQNITLANYTAEKIGAQNSALRYQLYAYSTHADVPDQSIKINERLDIQLVPAVYHNLTSTNGLRNRWYNRTKNLSEYNYLNLSNWSGETPSFSLNEFKETLQIAKDNKSQGLVWEASPAKFASLPFLMAANKNLLNNIAVDSSLVEFCNNMFAGAGKTVYSLLQLWTDNNSMAGVATTKYKLPLYFKMIGDAEQQIQQESAVVKARLNELKAYLHYMSLFLELSADQRPLSAKLDKAGALCIYLAKINKLQLVNSSYMIQTIARAYVSFPAFNDQYNHLTGTAYLQGNLPLITTAEIEADFKNDLSYYSGLVTDYRFESAEEITGKFDAAGVAPIKTISVQLNYTSGLDYYNRSEFFIYAPAAGSFTINYTPRFDTPEKGYINFLVESCDKTMTILKDFSIDQLAGVGTLTINLPFAGNYKLTLSSKYKSAVKLDIVTNKNFFYKNNIFMGSNTDAYESKSASLPGYFYIPAGTKRIYFSVENSNPGGVGFAAAEKINNNMGILDNAGKIVKAEIVSTTDSALFYFDVPAAGAGKFYQVTVKSSYRVVFANISNKMWFAGPKPPPCNSAGFTIAIIKKEGQCITQITANSNAGQYNWQVSDFGINYQFTNQRVIELPGSYSPNTLISLTITENCSYSRKLKDDGNYLQGMQHCASGSALPTMGIQPVIYPNPSTGIFNCMINGDHGVAGSVVIFNAEGKTLAHFTQTRQFNISHLPAGIYWYKMGCNGQEFVGKLVKL